MGNGAGGERAVLEECNKVENLLPAGIISLFYIPAEQKLSRLFFQFTDLGPRLESWMREDFSPFN
jgi:hypothetical protein